MTPIKYVLAYGLALFTVDFADHRTQHGTAVNAEQARWMAWSLGRAHNVPAYWQADDLSPREDISNGKGVYE